MSRYLATPTDSRRPYFETLARGLIEESCFEPLATFLQDRESLGRLRRLEADGCYPQEFVDELARLGALDFFRSSSALCTFNHIAYLTASLTRYNTSLGVILAVNGLAMLPLYLAASPEQLAMADAMLKRGELSCLMLSELDSGSNLGLIGSRYREEDDRFVLNGSKDMINGATRHRLAVILARSQDGARFSLLIYSGGFADASQRRWHTTAARGADISGVDFDELTLPKCSLLGAQGSGIGIVRKTLSLSRAGVAFFGAGIAAAAVERTSAYAHERRFTFPSGDKSIAQLGVIALHLRRQRAYELIAASVAWRSLLRVNEDGTGAALYTAISKYLCTTVAEKAVDEGTCVLSARALLRDEPYAQLITDARLFPIFDGTIHIILDEIAATAHAYCTAHTAPTACCTARRSVLATCRHKGPRRIDSPLLQCESLQLIPALEASELLNVTAQLLTMLTTALDDPAWPAQQELRHAAAKAICHIEGIFSVLLLGLNVNRVALNIAACEAPDPAVLALALALLFRELAGAAADMAALMLPSDTTVPLLGQLHGLAVVLMRR